MTDEDFAAEQKKWHDAMKKILASYSYLQVPPLYPKNEGQFQFTYSYDPETWACGVESTKFKYDIEAWLSVEKNKKEFKAALGGSPVCLDWLPLWVALGVQEIREKMGGEKK